MLKIENLKKHYDNFFLECSLQVNPGQVTGLIGQNGSGKSTTFKAILDLIHPDGGSITLFGKDNQDITPEDKEKLGVVLSDSGFSGYLRIKDIIPILENMYRQFDSSFFIKQVQRFSLPMDKQIKDFSTGMKAKLKVLAAVTHRAEFLLMDEPTTGLDVMAREGILDIFREYMEEDENRSILISSHISSDLEGLCDDIYMIHNGEIVFHEETDVMLNEYGLIKADDTQYRKLDKEYILRVRRESFGYSCLTDQKQYYLENYPDVVVEKGSLDEVITMIIGGEKL